jgi:folate-binding protein YgfZ
MDIDAYSHIRSGGAGFYEQKRGLIALWGKEAVQFLDGMISNDMKTLEDGQQMLAAFPNAQGRLLAVVRVLRQGDRFLMDTEESTRQKVFDNLYRFTYAGDFFVSDFSDEWQYFELLGDFDLPPVGDWFEFNSGRSRGYHVGKGDYELLRKYTFEQPDTVSITGETYETLRVESGIPKYGVDMDETTIVPELGLDGLISYNKGCYIGQEIIARIHFRGHVAKRLTGLVSEPGAIATGFLPGTELTAPDGKPAGRITSSTYSPKLERTIALAYVRYDYLAEGTELVVGDTSAIVKDLPFLE